MLRKSILIGLFVLKNNRIELKSLQRGYKRKLSPRDFFSGGTGKLEGFFARAVYRRPHGRQCVKLNSFLFYIAIWLEDCDLFVNRLLSSLSLFCIALLKLPFCTSYYFIGKLFLSLKDVRANCFCASLLRTTARANSHATSCIERARQVLK